MQSINAAPYTGKKFKLEAAVKVQTIDTTAEANLWVRVDKTNKKMGFFIIWPISPLLHGNSSSIGSINLQIPELARHYQVIAVDTRGQGKSGEDGKTYTYDLFAEDMNALLDYLHIDNTNVLGWSDGGNTGLIMAMKYPAKVKKL